MSLYDYWMEKRANDDSTLFSRLKNAYNDGISYFKEGSRVLSNLGNSVVNGDFPVAKTIFNKNFSVPGLTDSDHREIQDRMLMNKRIDDVWNESWNNSFLNDLHEIFKKIPDQHSKKPIVGLSIDEPIKSVF